MSYTEAALGRLRSDAIGIFTDALHACAIDAAFEKHLSFSGRTMKRRQSPVLPPVEQSLDAVKRVQIISFGKAAVPMLDAFIARLPPKLRVDGICSAPAVPQRGHKHIRYYQGSHPLPNEDSVASAHAALDLLHRAGPDTFVFFLISGGGSAICELPLDRTIPIEDVRAFYETLVLCGADIGEINTVRKYFSAIKGGRLAQAAASAEKLTLMLADVPLKELGTVASSPTLPDHSTWADCAAVLEKWELMPRFPATVRAYFQAMARNPVSSPTAADLGRTQFDVLLSNHDFVNAARDRARALGYKVVIDNTCDNWAYDRASRFLLERFEQLRREWPKVCLLPSGEVTVRIEGAKHGCGGRNQHFVLETAMHLQSERDAVAVLSAGSDGVDGNSPAAGAVADPTTVERARRFHFQPEDSLARFNACPLFTALGDALITGPTGNNLRDLRILLADRSTS